jgi:hypothetical protein
MDVGWGDPRDLLIHGPEYSLDKMESICFHDMRHVSDFSMNLLHILDTIDQPERIAEDFMRICMEVHEDREEYNLTDREWSEILDSIRAKIHIVDLTMHLKMDFGFVAESVSKNLDPGQYWCRIRTYPGFSSGHTDTYLSEPRLSCVLCKRDLASSRFVEVRDMHRRCAALWGKRRYMNPYKNTWIETGPPISKPLAQCYSHLPMFLESTINTMFAWKDFVTQNMYFRYIEDFWFVTDSSVLASEIRRLYYPDPDSAVLKFLGDLHTILPLDVAGRDLLVGLDRSKTWNYRKRKMESVSGFDDESDKRKLFAVGSDSASASFAYRDILAFTLEMLEFVNGLARNGYKIIPDFLLILHYSTLLRLGFKDDIHSTTTCVSAQGFVDICTECMLKEKMHDRYSDRTWLDSGIRQNEGRGFYEKQDRILRMVTGTLIGGIQQVKSVMEKHDSVLSRLYIDIKDLPKISLVEMATDAESCWTRLASALRFQEENQNRIEYRSIIPLPQWISILRIQSGDKIRVRLYIQQHTANFFMFLIDILALGFRLHPSLFSDGATFKNQHWFLDLHHLVQESGYRFDNPGSDSDRSGEIQWYKKLLESNNPPACLLYPPSASNHLLAYPPRTALFRALLQYRIDNIHTLPALDFWKRAIYFMDSNASEKYSVRILDANLAQKRYNIRRGNQYRITCKYASRDDPIEIKREFVTDFLSTLSGCKYQFDSIDGILNWCANLSIQFKMRTDFEDMIDSIAIGNGTVVHALDLFWDLFLDPELGFVDPYREYLRPNHGFLHADNHTLLIGLGIVCLMMYIYDMHGRLNFHPYLFYMIRRNQERSGPHGSHEMPNPLYELLSGCTKTTRVLLQTHLDVLFHTNPNEYLEYADSYMGYGELISNHVKREAEYVIPEEDRAIWVEHFLHPFYQYVSHIYGDKELLQDLDSVRRFTYFFTSGRCMDPNSNIPVIQKVMDACVVEYAGDQRFREPFYKMLGALSPDRIRKFLLFATGKSSHHHKDLISVNLYMYDLSKTEKPLPYPTSQTCFRKVHIYLDSTWKHEDIPGHLDKYMDFAFQHASYFGNE